MENGVGVGVELVGWPAGWLDGLGLGLLFSGLILVAFPEWTVSFCTRLLTDFPCPRLPRL